MTDIPLVTVVFSHHHREHLPGDTATIPANDAKRLVRAGVARHATTDELPEPVDTAEELVPETEDTETDPPATRPKPTRSKAKPSSS